MSTHTFIHESDAHLCPKTGACGQYEVEIETSASAEDEGGVDSLRIYSKITGTEMKLEDFPAAEQARIEATADEIAHEHAHEDYYEAQAARAEAAYDAWKEGD